MLTKGVLHNTKHKRAAENSYQTSNMQLIGKWIISGRDSIVKVDLTHFQSDYAKFTMV